MTERKKRSRTSLQFKLALMFFMVMVISSTISISILLIIFSPIMKENSSNQLISMADSMVTLAEDGHYSIDEIMSLVNDSTVSLNKISEYSPSVTENKAEIDKKGYYITTDGVIPSATIIVRVGDTYIEADSFTNENLYWMVNFVIIIAFIVCIIIGTIITAFVSKTVLQPIHDLSKATSEVARGNFSVRVEEPSDPEYGTLARNFNKMAQELSGIETLSGDFISSVSHEFKTPLASIQGFAKLLQDDNLSDADRREYTQIIIDETARLTKLSSNILRLTKLENQTSIGRKSRFSLDEQIRKIILMLEPEWTKKNIDLDIALDDIFYVGNEELMGQIWQNVINNAIKFTPENGEIKVMLFRSDTGIVAKISDNGPSIAPEIKDKIFEKFYQGDHSRATEGNGLGLALVKRIIDLCGGKISVENLYEGGVCFNIELPYQVEDMN